MMLYRERAVACGNQGSLIGVLTLPQGPPPEEVPIVLMLNSGVIHRVGANRLHVRLARSLAQAGYGSLRFDQSGIGDSERRRDCTDLREIARRDVNDVIAYLSDTLGTEKTVLFGLCSGANTAFLHAVQDSRVNALIMIDPIVFPTLLHYLNYFGRRLTKPRVWANVLRGRNRAVVEGLNRLLEPGANRDDEPPADTALLTPSKNEMRRGLEAIVGRDADMLFVFTAGIELLYSYRSQLDHTFPSVAKSPRVRVEHFRDTDHTFTDSRQRQRLAEVTLDWLHRVMPRATAPTDEARFNPGSGHAVQRR